MCQVKFLFLKILVRGPCDLVILEIVYPHPLHDNNYIYASRTTPHASRAKAMVRCMPSRWCMA